MTHYVLGFLFSSDRKRVVLIRKNKPEWQKGRHNGVGGKVEPSDASLHCAMVREFKEETDADVPLWKPFADLKGETARVVCFCATGDHAISTTTDEFVAWYPIDKLAKLAVIPNTRWLIPLALDESTLSTQAQF